MAWPCVAAAIKAFKKEILARNEQETLHFNREQGNIRWKKCGEGLSRKYLDEHEEFNFFK